VENRVREEAGAAIVSLSGEVDLEHSPRARAVLLEWVERGPRVLVDLSQVTYIDSSGVASLIEAFQLARKRSVDFALAEISPAALRVLELARLDRVFTIHPTVADGLAGGPLDGSR
jgi:anti-sigma B factor antagonist